MCQTLYFTREAKWHVQGHTNECNVWLRNDVGWAHFSDVVSSMQLCIFCLSSWASLAPHLGPPPQPCRFWTYCPSKHTTPAPLLTIVPSFGSVLFSELRENLQWNEQVWVDDPTCFNQDLDSVFISVQPHPSENVGHFHQLPVVLLPVHFPPPHAAAAVTFITTNDCCLACSVTRIKKQCMSFLRLVSFAQYVFLKFIHDILYRSIV